MIHLNRLLIRILGIENYWLHKLLPRGVLFLQKNKKLSFYGCQNRVLVRKYMRGRKLFTCPAAVDELFDNWIHLHRIHSCFCRVTYEPLQNRAMMSVNGARNGFCECRAAPGKATTESRDNDTPAQPQSGRAAYFRREPSQAMGAVAWEPRGGEIPVALVYAANRPLKAS